MSDEEGCAVIGETENQERETGSLLELTDSAGIASWDLDDVLTDIHINDERI